MARVASIDSLEAKIDDAKSRIGKYEGLIDKAYEDIGKWEAELENQLNKPVEEIDSDIEKLRKRLERMEAEKARRLELGETETETITASDVGTLEV